MSSLPALSLCIPTMNRWEFLRKNIPEYLKNPYIKEIVICDETGDDCSKVKAAFTDPKIKLHVNEQRLGAYLNKYKVVSLASNEWICLMDSDNFAPLSYFEAWEQFLAGRAPSACECFLPSRAMPNFNYSHFSENPITKENYKSVWKKQSAPPMFNTGNYIIPKSLYLKSVSSPELSKYDTTCLAFDVLFRNYFLLINNAIFYIVPNMTYTHVVHPGSYYITTHTKIDTKTFYNLYI